MSVKLMLSPVNNSETGMKTHAGIGFIVIDQVEEFFCIVLRRGLYKS